MWQRKSNKIVIGFLQKDAKHVKSPHPMVLADQDFNHQNQVISMSLVLNFLKKDVRGCWPAAAGAIINNVLNNPSKSAIALARSLPLPPVSRIAILVRKIQMSGQVVMSNLQWCAAVHASTQHLCSLDTSTLHKPLEK